MKPKSIDQERRHQLDIEGKARVRLVDSVKVNSSYKTLFYGLKMNHPHNVALIHPVAFVLRRILFALVILFMTSQTQVFFGAFLLQLTCLFMGIMIVMEMQWQDGLINVQHFVNEVFLYLFCVSMMLFTGVLEQSRQSVALGWLLIGLCCIMIIYNLAVILVDTLSFLHLLYKRYYSRHVAKKCSNVKLCQHLCKRKGFKDRES